MLLTLADALRGPLKSLSAHLVIAIPAAMVVGLGVGLMVDLAALKVLVLPLTMLMVYPMLVNFRPAEAFDFKDSRAVGVAMLLNFAVFPLVAWLFARSFFAGEPQLFVGMLLIGLFPTSGMTISWTGFARGNVAAAVKMTVLGLLVASVLAPLYLYALAGAVVDVDLLGIARTVLLIVFIPMIAGVATRRLIVRSYDPQTYKERIAPVFPGLSMVGVLAIVFLAIGLKARMIATDPVLLVRILVPLIAFYFVAFVLATLIGRYALRRDDAVAAVYGSVMRNLSIALGIAIASFGPEAALVLAAAYMVQVQGAAWYGRIADRVLCREPGCGAAKTEVSSV